MPQLPTFEPGRSPTVVDRPPLRQRHWPWRRPPRPTFLVIGAQKAGTSWLHQMLARHPRIFVSERKELQHFSTPERFDEGLGSYLQHFTDATWRHRAIGESTPNYLWASPHRSEEWGGRGGSDPDFRAGIPERIVDALGTDLRLIVLLRDPVDRAISAFYHHLRAKGDRLDPQLPFADNACRYGIVTMGFYAAHLEHWLEHIPPDRFLVLFQEELRAHPQDAIGAVHRHLGVRADPPSDLTAEVHVGTKHGSDDGVWYWDQDRQHVAIGPDERALLHEVYAPENDRLARLLGRPTPWSSDPLA